MHIESGVKRPYVLNMSIWTCVTTIECIRANGSTLSLMVIMPGKLHQSTWFGDSLPGNGVIAVSEKGCMNDSLALEWLIRVFELHTRIRRIGKYRALIMDGHGSQVTGNSFRNAGNLTSFRSACLRIAATCCSPMTRISKVGAS